MSKPPHEVECGGFVLRCSRNCVRLQECVGLHQQRFLAQARLRTAPPFPARTVARRRDAAQRRPVANGGITALILPDGRLAATASGAPGTLVVAAPLFHTISPYVRIGDAFAWLCVAGVPLGVLAAIQRAAGGANH